jgi:hypothetical protein
MGKILSELAFSGATAHDIAPFDFGRPVLFEEKPDWFFMV